MNRGYRSDHDLLPWQQVVLQYPCEVCGVPPGQRCITISGNAKSEPHSWRSRRASDDGWRMLDGD